MLTVFTTIDKKLFSFKLTSFNKVKTNAKLSVWQLYSIVCHDNLKHPE